MFEFNIDLRFRPSLQAAAYAVSAILHTFIEQKAMIEMIFHFWNEQNLEWEMCSIECGTSNIFLTSAKKIRVHQ